MIPALSLQRLFGFKADETRTVGLFLLHNFLLGIGSVLVYVAANVLLLEHDPARSLPLGYIVGALAMMVMGKVYTYFEHHYLLKKLAVRVLKTVAALTRVLNVLVAVGHSVAAAVATMAGCQVIYLLTKLEFWGVSAVVFDVRQSKRLFSIISAGDMPAKALAGHAPALLKHADERVRLALLAMPEARPLPVNTLIGLAQNDLAATVREYAACELATATPLESARKAQLLLLNGTDLAAQQGAIRGCPAVETGDLAARKSLRARLADVRPDARLAALALLKFFPAETQTRLIEDSLASGEAALTAIGTLGHPRLAPYLLIALGDQRRWQSAANGLMALGPAAVPLVREALPTAADSPLTHRLASVLERLGTSANRGTLVKLAQGPNLFSRAVALRALRHFPCMLADAPVFEQLLRERFALAALSMSHSTAPETRISALERVVVLQGTALFAHTPENVLSSIVPIMKEVTFQDGEEVFAKGDIGTSLFIVHNGQVGIFNGNQQQVTFGPSDFLANSPCSTPSHARPQRQPWAPCWPSASTRKISTT